jgi:uncharacterized protein YbaP (TraB family)
MRYLLKFLGLFLSAQFLIAQDSIKSIENALFWKIEKNENQKPSYLFGTIHLIPAADFFLPDGLETALGKSQKIFFEIDLDEMNDMGAMFGLVDKIMMKNDTSLSDLVSNEEYTKIKAYFENLGLPLAMFDRVKPMFLSAMAGTDGNPFALQDGSFKSYELELAELAKKKNIEVDGLESMEFQLSIFDSIPYAIQAKMLLESVAATKPDEDQVEQMYNNYKSQNLDALNQTISKEDQQLLPYLEMMLYNRNKNWIPIMKTEMAKDTCFFAVGAGHLAGEKGVIQLLRNEGYKVTPIISEK